MKFWLLPALKLANHAGSAGKAFWFRAAIRERNYVRGLFPARRVLVLAPHMDDEVIGCGGIMKQYAQVGACVSCVYMTDGAFGLTGCQRDEMVETRRRETQAAAALLGMERLYFLDQSDGCLRSHDALEQRLAGILSTERPDAVFAPYPFDVHPDHKHVLVVLARAAARLPETEFHIFLYQVQVPLGVDEIHTVLDISPVWEVKRRALEVYQSQVYVPFEVIRHLQCCQRYLIGFRPKAVEVFAHLELDELPALVRRLVAGGGMQVKQYAEVGALAIRRKRWI